MNNPILDDVIKERNGHYCHALEVDNVYEIESTIEELIGEGNEYTEDNYIEFFTTMELYYLPIDKHNDDDEKAVYDFNFKEYIEGTI